MELKYYFVYYECDIYFRGSNFVDESHNLQAIIDMHPLNWQLDFNEKNKWNGSGSAKTCKVITWNRLTLEEYKEFEGKVK